MCAAEASIMNMRRHLEPETARERACLLDMAPSCVLPTTGVTSLTDLVCEPSWVSTTCEVGSFEVRTRSTPSGSLKTVMGPLAIRRLTGDRREGVFVAHKEKITRASARIASQTALPRLAGTQLRWARAKPIWASLTMPALVVDSGRHHLLATLKPQLLN